MTFALCILRGELRPELQRLPLHVVDREYLLGYSVSKGFCLGWTGESLRGQSEAPRGTA